MLIDQLIERDGIKMDIMNEVPGEYTLVISRGDRQIVTTFSYKGNRVNLSIMLVLAVRLMKSYNVEMLSQNEWQEHYQKTPVMIDGPMNYDRAREHLVQIKYLLGLRYNEYIEALQKNNLIKITYFLRPTREILTDDLLQA